MENRAARGTPEDLFNSEAQRLVASMAYPEMFAFLYSTRGPEQAMADLHDIVSRIFQQLMNVWRPKPTSLKKIIQKSFKLIGDKDIKVKVIAKDEKKRPLQVRIIDKDCVFCPSEDRETKVPKEVPFCIAVSFALETIIKILISRWFRFDFQYIPKKTTIRTETVASRSSGNPHCEHIIHFNFGE